MLQAFNLIFVLRFRQHWHVWHILLSVFLKTFHDLSRSTRVGYKIIKARVFMVSHYTNVKQRLLGYAVFPFRRICKSNTSNNFDGFSFNRFFATLYKRVLSLSALLLLSLLVLYSPVSPTPSAPFSPGLPPTPPPTHTPYSSTTRCSVKAQVL